MSSSNDLDSSLFWVVDYIKFIFRNCKIHVKILSGKIHFDRIRLSSLICVIKSKCFNAAIFYDPIRNPSFIARSDKIITRRLMRCEIPVAHMRISRKNGGLCRRRWRGSKFARRLKVSRSRNLRKDAGDIEESNLDRSSKGLQLGTCYGITTVRLLCCNSEQFYKGSGI